MKIELSHDILAKKVYEKVSAEDKSLRKVERFIHDRFVFHQGKSRKLSRPEINYIRPYFAKVDIKAEERKFVEEGIRLQRQRLIIAGIVLSLLLIGLTIASSTFYSLWANAEVLQMQADSARGVAEAQRLIAIKEAERADSSAGVAKEQRLIAIAQSEEAERQRVFAMASANQARAAERKARTAAAKAEAAREEAEKAKVAAEAAQANEKIEREKANNLRLIALQKARAANLLTAQSLATQSLAIEDDDNLRYVLARDAYRIHECYRTDSLGNEWGNPNDATIYNASYQSYRALKNEASAFELFGATRGVVRGIAFDDDRYFYSAGSDGKLYRSLYAEDPITNAFQVDTTNPIQNLDWELGRILQLVKSPNNQLLALAGEGDQVIVYNQQNATSSAIRYREASQIQDTARAIVFLDDQYVLVAHSRTQEVRILNLALRTFSAMNLEIESNLIQLSFDHQHQRLAATDLNGKLYLWQVNNQDGNFSFIPIKVTTPNAVFTALSFRPGFTQLAVGSREGSVYLFGPSEGNFVQEDILWGHKGNVAALTFDAQHRQLASASFDGTIRIWDLGNRNYRKYGAKVLAENYPLTSGNNPWAFSLSFSPDGHYLLCGYKNGTIKTWPLLTSDLNQWTENLMQDQTLEESYEQSIWDRYVGDDIKRETLLECN